MLASGSLSGLNLAIFKVLGEAMSTNMEYFKSFFLLFLLFSGFVGAGLELYLMNIAMKTYRQIDVIPMFESFALLLTITCGLMLFRESELYTWLQLVGIMGCALVIILGIVVISMKNSFQYVKETN